MKLVKFLRILTGLTLAGFGSSAFAMSIGITVNGQTVQIKPAVSALPICKNDRANAFQIRALKALPVVQVNADQTDALVRIEGSVVPVSRLLVRSGLAKPNAGITDDLSVAIAERLGYWSCAPVTSLFKIARVQTDPRVLAAVALRESGVSKGAFWPWSINWRGKAYRYANRDQAIQAAKVLITNGFSSFDVGPMQINWKWNGHRFASIEQAFNPLANVRAADAILVEGFQRTRSWEKAIADYHSRDVERGSRYLSGVKEQLLIVQQEIERTTITQENS